MTRFALLPPDIQALERERQMLTRRLAFLPHNSTRARMLREQHMSLTRQLIGLELHLRNGCQTTPGKPVVEYPDTLGDSAGETRQRGRYWWTEE